METMEMNNNIRALYGDEKNGEWSSLLYECKKIVSLFLTHRLYAGANEAVSSFSYVDSWSEEWWAKELKVDDEEVSPTPLPDKEEEDEHEKEAPDSPSPSDSKPKFDVCLLILSLDSSTSRCFIVLQIVAFLV